MRMDLLHEYNDVKDAGQALLGLLGSFRVFWYCNSSKTHTPNEFVLIFFALTHNTAQVRGITTRQLYPDFGLGLDD